MINIRTLKRIDREGTGGLTLKYGKSIRYVSGWQVAVEGFETTDMREAMNMIKFYGGNCGVWLEQGTWYIDRSFRVATKHEAMRIGREHNQISVLKWSNMTIHYCR